ncbi:septal ring factor EnvC (AmiA/AmiB activator) [Methanohalophilus levihalophilus]|uniref:hypothetical protein n=1 Tax=Methanohalophilus levihalophilus TaxID=1431282 RepID=UPI001AEA36A3|nr:hypothetical protein [Methanohalophilus levihalophilus]MBP2031308.1 septal ring factor EnvC (AmiA/AmiB activator) [Methanohalophilus levihalophilus]
MQQTFKVPYPHFVAVMNFIERIFGKKQEEAPSQPVVFELVELSSIVQDEIKKQEELLDPVVKDKFEDITHYVGELDKLKNDLLEATPLEEAGKRGEKLGDSNRDNVVHNMETIHNKLKIPENNSPVVAAEFCIDAKSTLKIVLDNTRRSLMYIKALYPQEHQKINKGLADLEDTIDGLYSSVIEGNERIEDLMKISEEASNIKKIQNGMKASTTALSELAEKYESAKKALSDYDSRLAELDNSGDLEMAKDLENKIRELDSKISDIGLEARRLFTPLSKAISRMEKQDKNEMCVLSPENREILKSINENPFHAIEYDLDPFLSELASRVESGELGLKDHMCDKVLKQVHVLNDKMNTSSLVEQKKAYLSEKEKLRQELNGLSIYRQREELEKEIEDQQVLISSVNSDINSEKTHLNNLEEELERVRSVLLSDVRHVFGDKTDIKY